LIQIRRWLAARGGESAVDDEVNFFLSEISQEFSYFSAQLQNRAIKYGNTISGEFQHSSGASRRYDQPLCTKSSIPSQPLCIEIEGST
jgi:hypothetical protein